MPEPTVQCRDQDGNYYEAKISELSFRPSIYGVIVKDGKVLLSRDSKSYDYPGGKIELGESLEQALVREVKEETGLDVKPQKLIYCGSSFFKHPYSGDFFQSILIYYTCEITGGEISLDYLDTVEIGVLQKPEWIDLDKVDNLHFGNADVDGRILKSLK